MERQPSGGDGPVFSFGVGLFHFFSLFPFLFRYPQYTGSGLGELVENLTNLAIPQAMPLQLPDLVEISLTHF